MRETQGWCRQSPCVYNGDRPAFRCRVEAANVEFISHVDDSGFHSDHRGCRYRQHLERRHYGAVVAGPRRDASIDTGSTCLPKHAAIEYGHRAAAEDEVDAVERFARPNIRGGHAGGPSQAGHLRRVRVRLAERIAKPSRFQQCR